MPRQGRPLSWRLSIAGAFFLAACSAAAERPAGITISNGWARETAPGQSAAAAYLTIVNQGEGEDRLISVEAEKPAVATLHSTSSTDGIARMRRLEAGLDIGPRSTVELKPGGTHIMLTGLGQRLSPGESIGLTLAFARSGKRTLAVRVVPAGDDGQSHGMSH